MKNENRKNKNITHAWSLLCQSSSIDSTNNNLSLFKILEEVQFEAVSTLGQPLPEVYNIPLSFSLITLWNKRVQGANVTASIEVKLVDPKGKELKKINYELTIPPEKNR